MDSSPKRAVRQLTAHYSSMSVFDIGGKQKLDDLNIANCNPSINDGAHENVKESDISEASNILDRKLVVADCMSCNCCQIQFADRDEQLDHYKCDWHRYNLHLRLKGLPCVTEEQFEAAAGDVSSISGSDDEDQDNTDTRNEKVPIAETPDIKTEHTLVLSERKFHKVFFKTKEGELISVHRCLLHHKKNPLYDHEDLVSAVKSIPSKRKWIILMVSSGHFAGAVFQGKDVQEHKTFHRYTIRAKRGTAQSTKDNQGSAPKSGGASLRRYNEAALVQEVQELLTNWMEHLRTCDYVFVRIPVANRAMFYGGKNPSLKKDDPRIRVIPFATRRPTYSEVKRVHQMLSEVECYGQEALLGNIIPISPKRIYNNDTDQLEVVQGSPRQGRAGSKKYIQNVDTKTTDTDDRVVSEERIVNSTEGEDHKDEEKADVILVESIENIDFSDLKEFDCSVKVKTRKKKKGTGTKNEMATQNPVKNDITSPWKNSLFTACKTGNVHSLQNIVKEICQCHLKTSESPCHESAKEDLKNTENGHQNLPTENANSDTKSTVNDKQLSSGIGDSTSIHESSCPVVQIVNTPLGEAETTFLHVAAKDNHGTIVTELLYAGADPALKDRGGKLPYNLGDTEVRNALRRFMASFPDTYDYAKAQVPSPLFAEMEAQKKQKAAEKRKVKKKAAQERNKEKKAEEAKERLENKERERFLALSDREKRALAAERRILQQYSEQDISKPVLSRCWQCGVDITGKVPFEYSEYKFCTTKCLREHRSKSTS